ncbi:MAG: hypothetical protein Q7R30_17605 [Acidobacteriota bacterium]|nr:hypothetical protein [Acidobacteriota bacterium]
MSERELAKDRKRFGTPLPQQKRARHSPDRGNDDRDQRQQAQRRRPDGAASGNGRGIQALRLGQMLLKVAEIFDEVAGGPVPLIGVLRETSLPSPA